MKGSSGELIVFGMNLRTYDVTKQIWNMKWLNALTGTWVDLGPEELGGVRFDGQSIIYAFKEPVAAHSYTRAAFANISKTHFTWRGEKLMTGSPGANSWSLRPIVATSRTPTEFHPGLLGYNVARRLEG
jgi:hypothetical protein